MISSPEWRSPAVHVSRLCCHPATSLSVLLALLPLQPAARDPVAAVYVFLARANPSLSRCPNASLICSASLRFTDFQIVESPRSIGRMSATGADNRGKVAVCLRVFTAPPPIVTDCLWISVNIQRRHRTLSRGTSHFRMFSVFGPSGGGNGTDYERLRFASGDLLGSSILSSVSRLYSLHPSNEPPQKQWLYTCSIQTQQFM